MFYLATLGPGSFAYVQGPLPSGLIGGASDGHSTDLNQFKFSFFKSADFVGAVKALQNHFMHGFVLAVSVSIRR